MAGESITMSKRELDRLGIIQAVVGKQVRQTDAASQLGVSARQVTRQLS